jgi:hypothetical protein
MENGLELVDFVFSLSTFLGGVDTNDVTNNPWRPSVNLNGIPTEFNID